MEGIGLDRQAWVWTGEESQGPLRAERGRAPQVRFGRSDDGGKFSRQTGAECEGWLGSGRDRQAGESKGSASGGEMLTREREHDTVRTR
jgi:hypothetical protein